MHFVARRMRVLYKVEFKTAFDKKVAQEIFIRFFDPEVQHGIELLVTLDHLIVNLELSQFRVWVSDWVDRVLPEGAFLARLR